MVLMGVDSNPVQTSGKRSSRLLILSSSFPRFVGDLQGHFIYELATRLNQGNYVTVLCPRAEKTLKTESLNGLSICRFSYFYPHQFQYLTRDGGIAYNFKHGFLAKLQIPLFLISELLYTVATVRKLKIEVINSHWLVPQGFVAAICNKIFGVKHILTIHSSEVTLIKKVPLGRSIANFTLQHSDAVVSVSKHRARELLDFIDPKLRPEIYKKLHVVPMGVSITKTQGNLNKDSLREKYGISAKNIILFVGRLVEVKGCEYLIRAMAELVHDKTDVLLIVAGSGPLEEQLVTLARQHGLESHARFLGTVEHSLIPELFTLADVVVVPSIIDSFGFQEGLPVVLLESMSHGKAVIGTETKGILEVITDGANGLVVEPQNVTELEQKIRMLIDDDELLQNLSENARKSAETYGWPVIVERYTSIIGSINPQ